MIGTWVWHYLVSNWVELAGAATTALGIWLTARRNMLCWPITLAADLLYLVVFYRVQLLSDTLLQVFFVVFTLYGWLHWWKGVQAEGEVKVVKLPVASGLVAVVLGVGGAVILGVLAKRLHAALPYLDASLASFSLVASWWQARKHIANWWTWIVVDIVYVGEYIYKDLWLTAVIYARLAARAGGGLDGKLHDVVQRLTVHVAAQLVRGHTQGTRAKFRAGTADVRRDEQIGAAPERVAFRQRLWIGDVDGGANPSRVQGIDECVRLHDGAAGRIDQERTLGHAVELSRADQATRFFGERQYQDDDIGIRQQAVEFADRMNQRLSTSAACHARQVDLKRREHALDLFADGAISDDEDRLAGEFFLHDGWMQQALVSAESLVLSGGFLAATPVA
jgi:nicotinamide mononucleotide transporter